MKKKLIAVLLAAVTVMCTLASCGGGTDKGTVTLYVYNWGEYISDGSEGSLDTNKAFEDYCNGSEEIMALTGGKKVKVNYSTYASNEDLYAKLESKTVSYDVVIPSDYMISRLIKEGLLQKIDTSKMENYVNIDDKFKNLYFDTNNEYCVPYTYGTVGIIYDTKGVDAKDVEDQSWALMWNEKYEGNILQFNNPRDAFATAQFYQGNSVNSTDEQTWRSAAELLKKQKSVVQGYVMDEVFNKMKSGSALIAPYYAGDFLTMYEDNEDLAFYYPKEGTNVFVDAMCVPANAKSPELAAEYINFMLSEEIAIANAEAICYASPNKLVFENEDYKADMAEIHEDVMDILYGYNDENMEYFHDLPDDTRNLMNDLWEELKIDSGKGYVVYIVFAIVAAAVILLIIIFAIRKKRKALAY
ncbi:MAG: spermidine/putrescine ABC transporter substrate-binding protein [Clostridia bacterium]|nr:spermidine/putrescine ABC transporter substrate-binding protein [Clostridia bacterium]